jgi:hypothetical protein
MQLVSNIKKILNNYDYYVWRFFVSKFEMAVFLSVSFKHCNPFENFAFSIDNDQVSGELYFKYPPSQELTDDINNYLAQISELCKGSLVHDLLYCIGAIWVNFTLGLINRVKKLFSINK